GAVASAKPASLAINRNLSFIPSIQAVSRAQPKTAIAGGENGKDPSAGETLLFGEGWDGKVAKLVQAISGRHPNIALAILEERENRLARQTVGSIKQICSALVQMQQSAIYQRANPKASITLPKQLIRLKWQRGRKRIRFRFTVSQLCDPRTLGNQDSAVVALVQRVDSLTRIWHGIELGTTRLPTPQAIRRSGPEVAAAVCVWRGAP